MKNIFKNNPITIMEKLKQISVKLDADTLARIDAMATSAFFWRRNTIINALLTAVMRSADERTLMKLVRWSPADGDRPSITFVPSSE